MKVIHARPPVYDAICEAIGTPSEHAVYAYGDAVFVPSGAPLSPDLCVHEAVHLHQQLDAGGPEAWWRLYLSVPGFRLAQEVEAYRAQIKSFAGRAARRECLRRVARDLAGPLYGLDVTVDQARRLLWA